MTLDQLAGLKQWHVAHRCQHPVEFHAWDAVLTLWLIGWIGLAPAVLLDELYGVVLCTLLFFAPSGYVNLRRRLHRKGRLRCDWLEAAR
jgi:hypothetical protein